VIFFVALGVAVAAIAAWWVWRRRRKRAVSEP